MISSKDLIKIFDVSPVASILLLPDAPNFTVAEVNQAYLRVTNTEREDLIGKSIFEAFPENPDDLVSNGVSNLLNSLHTTISTREPHKMVTQKYDIPIRGTSKFEIKHWNIENIPVIDKSGQISYIIHTLQDVTEKISLKSAQSNLNEELTKRNSFIETIIDRLPIGIAVNKISTGKATVINKSFAEIYGWSEDDLTNLSTFFQKVYPDEAYRKEIMAQVLTDVESGEPDRMRWNGVTIATSTGEKRVINAKNIPVFEQDLMISTVVDVTQMANSASEVYSTKINQEALINSTNDLIWSIDKNLCVVSFNKAYQEVFKVFTDKTIKCGDCVLLEEHGEAYINEWTSYYERALKGEAYIAKIEVFNPESLTIEYRETSFKPICNSSEEVIGVACHCKNITESRYYLELEKLERDILEMHAAGGQNRVDVISQYMLGIESLHPGMLCSMQEIKDNRLYSLASPSLPKDYLDYIEGIEIGNNVGSCSTAVYLKDKVIVSDILSDTRWVNYKELAIKYNLRACWSHPIIDFNGNVVATFAAYYSEVKSPTYFEDNTIQRAGHILKVLLEGYRKEDALNESIQRYEYVTKATFDAIWDWDAVTNNVYLGDGFKELFGELSNHLSIDKHTNYSRIHPDDQEQVVLSATKAIKSTDTKWSHDFRYLKSDGSYAYVLNRAVILRDSSGRATRVIGAMQDITKSKKEEQRLKLMESLISNTNDAVLFAEAAENGIGEPVITYVNEAFIKLTGYKTEEVLGKSPYLLKGPDSNWSELDRIWKVKDSSDHCVVNVLNYRKNGEEFWANLSVSALTDEKGRVTNWIHIGRDITERKQEEKQKKLLADIALQFNDGNSLKETLQIVIEKIADYGQCNLAEVWLLDNGKKNINLAAYTNKSHAIKEFYTSESNPKSFKIGEGLPGKCWKENALLLWNENDLNNYFCRFEAAKIAGIKSAYALPVKHNNDFIGVILLGMTKEVEINCNSCNLLLENFGTQLGSKIKRKQLEQEINQVFMLAPDIICIANLDGYFTKVNPAMSTILEYSEDELTSIPFFDFIHPDDKSIAEEHYQKSINGIPSVNFEIRCITKYGRIVWVAWSVSPSIEDGILFCVAKDITEKKDLESLLSRANNLAQIGGWEYDIIQDKLYWSDITRNIVEVDSDYEQTLENTIQLYKEGADRDLLTQKAEEAIEFGTSFDLEVQIVLPNGTEKWVRVISESEVVDGKCIRTYGSFQDIDDRKRAEMALMDALIERNTVLESIGDGFFAIDFNWVVTYWNKKAEVLLKRPKDEILGQNAWEVYTDVVDTSFYHYYHKAMEERTVQHFESFYDTLAAWYEVSAYPSTNGISVYFKDITERKLSEIKLTELNENVQKHAKELAISNADLEQFAYVASHDLQEPLRMVTSFLTRLETKYGDVLDEKGKKYIYFAVDGAKRMRQIILDLLEFSRVGRIEDTKENLDLNELVTEIQILYRKQIEEKRADIQLDRLPIIHESKSSFRQVFQNLIGNALKYSRKTPVKINITVKDFEKYWLFAVQDNGIGIEDEYFDKIFVIFQRLHSIEEFSGTGMGLALTKKIIENLGGDIWVDSKIGEGSTFYFTLPKARNL